MNNSDNLAALLYIKGKLHKWKNIAILLAVTSSLLLLNGLFGSDFKGGVIEEDYIANIKIDQVIFEDDHRSEALEKIAANKSIKAVIININSPGGGIVGSEILFNNLREIAKAKPTVVLMGSLAASGGYMAAISADYIIAHNGTLTGSIGVLMETPEVTVLAKKLGVKFNSYKSSPLKGSPSMFEKPTPEVNAAIKESIDDSYRFFVELVKERRGEKLKKSQLQKIFNGQVFTGRQALELGLIDKVGSKKDALKYLEQQKIDVKKLPTHQVEIKKSEKRFFNKFLNLLPFFSENNAKNNQQIMAVIS